MNLNTDAGKGMAMREFVLFETQPSATMLNIFEMLHVAKDFHFDN